MTEIVLYANGQRLETQTEPLVVAKSRNEYTAAFTFSDDWKKITKKTAVFRRYADGQSFTVDLDSDGKCKVPWEVLDPPRFHVSAFGGNLRTMTETYINVEKTGYDENAVPSATVPQIHPTPTDLKLENGKIHLIAGQNTIGTGAELPTVTVDEELSATSENPVQNKAVKTYVDETVRNSTMHDILTMTVENDADNVDGFVFSLDSEGNPFSLHKILITGKLLINYDYSAVTNKKINFKIRTNGGVRYLTLLYLTGVEQIVFSATVDYANSITTTKLSYLENMTNSQGIDSSIVKESTFMATTVAKPIEDIDVYISLDGIPTRLPLLAGSYVTVRGC